MFFIATADGDGQPECSYKGGLPGFVRVVDDRTLAIPDYDGNGQYRSWGNVLANPKVGLLFIDFETPKRLRVNGTAVVSHDDPLIAEIPGAVFVVRLAAERIFPNCPRYIHKMQLVGPAARRGPFTAGAAWEGHVGDALPHAIARSNARQMRPGIARSSPGAH
jgi:predicted pyridoxine 5'-phosphate oxidase superfamily flavin-nucleotide-binding protein